MCRDGAQDSDNPVEMVTCPLMSGSAAFDGLRIVFTRSLFLHFTLHMKVYVYVYVIYNFGAQFWTLLAGTVSPRWVAPAQKAH